MAERAADGKGKGGEWKKDHNYGQCEMKETAFWNTLEHVAFSLKIIIYQN